MSKYTLKSIDLYVSGIKQTTGWVHISDGYIYIARDKGRTYWVLSKIEKSKRPIIKFNDSLKTIKIGASKIVFKGPKYYKAAKKCLENYTRQ